MLADKILELRKQNGWSQEELAERVNVSRQSISKWEGAQSIPDVDKLMMLSEIFGVSVDYLLKDTPSSELPTEVYHEPDNLKTITMEQANDYIIKSKKNGLLNAIGVLMCIISPALLIFLAGQNDAGRLSEKVAVGAGIATLLGLIAVAVCIFIYSESLVGDYAFLKKETFRLNYDVESLAENTIRKGRGKNTLAVAIGVMLCVVCPLPLIIASILYAPNHVIVAMVSVLLIMVAVAVFLFIAFSAEKEACEVLLQRGEFAVEEKKISGKMEVIGGTYWLLATAGYLAWSFTTNDWGKTWIVWPIAGILYAIIATIAKAVFKKEQ